MKVQAIELEGVQLDAAVALAEGWTVSHVEPSGYFDAHKDGAFSASGGLEFSTDWDQGGPIIERERIKVIHEHGEGEDAHWYAACRSFEGVGPTPLVAAMRAYVASKLGTEVEL